MGEVIHRVISSVDRAMREGAPSDRGAFVLPGDTAQKLK